jgi:hypothetical protein
VDPSSLLLRPFVGVLYQPWMMTDGDDCGVISGMNEWQGKQKYSVETCPSAALTRVRIRAVAAGSRTYLPVPVHTGIYHSEL